MDSQQPTRATFATYFPDHSQPPSHASVPEPASLQLQQPTPLNPFTSALMSFDPHSPNPALDALLYPSSKDGEDVNLSKAYANPGDLNLQQFPYFAFPSAAAPLVASTDAYATATRLSSTTQQEFEASYSDFLHSSLFADDDAEVPGLEPDSAELDKFDDDAFELFPPSTEPAPAPAVPAAAETASVLRPSSSSARASSSTPAPVALPSRGHLPSTIPLSSILTPEQEAALTPPTRNTTRKATGFRASASLVPLDAPIQSRNYTSQSATSRKRKTTAVERKLVKRGVSVKDEEEEENGREGSEIPDDLLEAAERKRLQNTLSARKSRARKQEKLAELEQENYELKGKNQGLEARVQQLEAMMRSMGIEP
ncbi:transcription factor [Pseudohyphozyma bogoriensis]|nr:transcription factor [Pseudohyphozyma bogoriensis]